MPAYILVQGDVRDPDAYRWYAERSPHVVGSYGGRFLVRTQTPELLEGALAAKRTVIIEFPDVAAARAFYHSPEYRELKKYRQPHAELSFVLLEGYSPPPPTAPR